MLCASKAVCFRVCILGLDAHPQKESAKDVLARLILSIENSGDFGIQHDPTLAIHVQSMPVQDSENTKREQRHMFVS